MGPDGMRRDRLFDDLMEVLEGCDGDLRLVLSPDGAELSRMIRDPAAVVEGNRFIRDLVRRAPGRLMGSCTVNPHFLEESVRAMDLCFGEWGFVQLGEMLPYMMEYRIDCDAVERLVRKAVEYRAPVQVHLSTSNSRTHASSFGREQLLDLFACARRVPEANYILAHAVGTPKHDPPVVDEYLDMIEGVYGDWPGHFWMEVADFSSPGLRSALRRVPRNRLIAGTDWTTRVGPPFLPYGTVAAGIWVKSVEQNPYPPGISALVGFLRNQGATEADIRRIGYRNSAELLRRGDGA
jgi:predicted TIM-barrel fold metal-dependent hydrolase